jgi:outer membrane protein assembly factor BamB
MKSRCHTPRFRICSPVVVAFAAVMLTVSQSSSMFAAPSPEQAKWASDIYKATGVQGGVVVHLSNGDAEKTAALRGNDRFQVQGLYPEPGQVAAARKKLLERGEYGLTAAEHLQGKTLPYIQNFVNLIVAEETLGISEDEMLRILVPNGVAYIRAGERWRKVFKPRPKEMDEWTHFLHSASGNAVAHDNLVGPPDGLQWVGSPRWSRHHDRMASMSAMVSANGRIFYIMDEGSRVSILLPSKWQLVARDAFNGAVLWRKEIPNWNSQLWPLKTGPTQLARRLVAVGDRVFVTLGLDAPVLALNGATGEKVREFEETSGTEEILHDSNSLVMLVNRGDMEMRRFTPQSPNVETKRVETDLPWNEQPRELRCVDATTGKVAWTMGTKVAPLTLTADKDHVIFHDGERLVCVERKLGSVVWVSEPASRRKYLPFNFGPRVVLHGDVVLYAGGDGKMKAYSKADGKELWEANHPRSGYQSPQDLMVASGLVWCAPTTSTGDSGVFTGRDPKTGEVKHEFPPDVSTYWFHHRCYIAKATDRFLIPSRTGIEFVDLSAKKWDINHWVRGGCLYGVMPCNGMTYAPPHDCACYPEAKLYGMNALSSGAVNKTLAKNVSDEGRCQQGPAFDAPLTEATAAATDWPTYRGDVARSGSVSHSLPGQLTQRWRSQLKGPLSGLVVANGMVFVSQVDAHSVLALSAATGDKLWSYTTGARVDSPPTYDNGRLVFGSSDGYVYCVRATDGELIWRFRAAPADRRMMAFEQIESVWPVHGSVLVEKGIATLVAGRSSFLDGGMRLIRLDARTGKKLQEIVIDDTDPESGKELQEKLQTLQMPVGLPDILSSDGEFTFLRSQRIDKDGKRLDLGPVSGNAIEQGSAQSGEFRHLFAPMGFLDDTYFHRAYWVFGRNFAGGHSGYFQAGKYTPSGRMLVNNANEVFSYGRLPEYFRWTTTIEHELFCTSKDPPVVPARAKGAASGAAPVEIASVNSLDPAGKELTVEAWVMPETPNGVIVSHGGPQNGFTLYLDNRRPSFAIRSNSELGVAMSPVPISQGWNHLAGTISKDGTLRVYVNGREAAKARAAKLIAALPKQPLQIADDTAGSVGAYNFPTRFGGIIDEVRVYFAGLSEEQLALSLHDPDQARKRQPQPVLSLTFDDDSAQDQSGKKHNGKVADAQFASGKFGKGLRARPSGNQAAGGSFVAMKWRRPVPLFARAMALAGDTLFVAGPRDIQNEEESFKRIAQSDPEIVKVLQRQDDCMEGKEGSLLLAVSAKDGKTLQEIEMSHLPVWDGLAIAGSELFIATADGAVSCLTAKNSN